MIGVWVGVRNMCVCDLSSGWMDERVSGWVGAWMCVRERHREGGEQREREGGVWGGGGVVER